MPGGMRAPRLTLGLLLCIALDFSSPYVGGAFTFSADESVEGVRDERESRLAVPVAIRAAVPVPDAVSTSLVARRASSHRPGVSGDQRPARRSPPAATSDPPAGVDDH
jgi:hypothetical protein